MRVRRILAVVLLTSVCSVASTTAIADHERTRDVIYGRKHGCVLTMDVLEPADANGFGLIWIVSGGWFSHHDAIHPKLVEKLLERGYTVFAVVHGSQPKFAIPEIIEDIHRAVRFIRHHAEDYGVDPGRLGVFGASAGGHLSLMQGVAPKEGDPEAKDPVDRHSSRVQAVACFFPPTDFLNYGKEGNNALGRGTLANFQAPFDFKEHDKSRNVYVTIADEDKRIEIGKAISPVYHVTADDAPSLILHGDADELVPIQQAELIVKRFQDSGVECKLVVKPGQAHGWPDLFDDLALFADWFDAHLRESKD